VLAWLSVWSKVQTCIWPSGFHCHSLSLASVKSRLVLPFWYRLTRVIPDKGPLNGCVCVCVFRSLLISDGRATGQRQRRHLIALFQVTPIPHQAFSQVVDVTNLRFAYALQHITSYIVIYSSCRLFSSKATGLVRRILVWLPN